MAFDSIYQIAGSAMNAQTVRLNTVASNLANVDSAAGAAKQKPELPPQQDEVRRPDPEPDTRSPDHPDYSR